MAVQNAAISTTFTRLLAERPVLIADGGMGTSLFALGMEAGACPELLNVEKPDLILTAHKGFLDAGSDIILTNTFGGTRRRLGLHKLEDRCCRTEPGRHVDPSKISSPSTIVRSPSPAVSAPPATSSFRSGLSTMKPRWPRSPSRWMHSSKAA